ncbi:MAG: PAS domain-containing protein [Burkholderiales bacterium]|nr:PAS domain-containing protein [Burkholderiales bacterium]
MNPPELAPQSLPEIAPGSALVMVLDAQRSIRCMNPALATLAGYDERALIGQPFPLLRHPDTPAEVLREMWRQVEGGSTWVAPLALRCRGGASLWALATCTPMCHVRLGEIAVLVLMRPSTVQLEAAQERYAMMRSRITIWLDKLMLEPLELKRVQRW